MTTSRTEEAPNPVPPSDELLRDWIGRFGSMIQRPTFETDKAHADDFVALFGICTQAVRNAEAYIVCEQAGFVREAQTLSRAALEHAVTAQWCYFRETGISRLAADHIEQRFAYYNAMADWLGDDALREGAKKLTRAPEGAKRMPKFGQLLAELDENTFLKTMYMNLSRVTHVTDATVGEYVHQLPDGTFEVNLAPDFAFASGGLFMAAAAALMGAAMIADLTLDRTSIEILDKASDELGAPLLLRQYLAPEIRRDIATLIPEG
jgi:hypothetical protein